MRSATEGQPEPSACTPNQLFVPPDLRSDVIQWAHTSKGLVTFLSKGFGHQPWRRTKKSLLTPAQSATNTSCPIRILLVSFRHSLFHIVLSPISPWALSQACPLCQGNCQIGPPPCLLTSWSPCWCAVRLGTPIYLSLLERETSANRHSTQEPTYQVGQRVWLSSCDRPLRVESKKLAARFIGSLLKGSSLPPVAVRLKLPQSMQCHPTFHVSQVNQSKEAPWSLLLLLHNLLDSSMRDSRTHYIASSGPTAGKGSPISAWLGGLWTWREVLGSSLPHNGPPSYQGFLLTAPRITHKDYGGSKNPRCVAPPHIGRRKIHLQKGRGHLQMSVQHSSISKSWFGVSSPLEIKFMAWPSVPNLTFITTKLCINVSWPKRSATQPPCH